MLVQVPDLLLLIQLLVNVPGKAVEVDLSTWDPGIHMRDPDGLLTPGAVVARHLCASAF